MMGPQVRSTSSETHGMHFQQLASLTYVLRRSKQRGWREVEDIPDKIHLG